MAVLALAFSGVAVAQEGEAPAKKTPQDALEAAEMAGLTTFLKAAEVAGLKETLIEENITVFAPTNEAFAALGEEQLNALLAKPAALKKVLENHLVTDGRLMLLTLPEVSPIVTAGEAEWDSRLEMPEGETNPKKGTVYVNDVEIKRSARSMTLNHSVLYSIDKVLQAKAE